MHRAWPLLLVALIAPLPGLADPLAGVWRTQAGRDGGFGEVTITPCADRLCGTVTRTFDAAGRETRGPDLGAEILRDLRGDGGGSYPEGTITDPESGRSYRARLRLTGPDRLEVGGCIMVFCRTAGTWQRVE
ncbi:DUF2147 domain-containing protein [Frigidibacter sp. MR17.24]|uniref:DUF2147 domain-containing protein n=1 Tax=Frigidibacter sp. MR17.24 TaxID=3127345 RepID=UPI0030131689